MLKTIGERATAVNDRTHNLGEVFAVIQAQASDAALLHTARLYDAPSRQYDTLSIRTILRDLREHADTLTFHDAYNATRDLRMLGMQAAAVSAIENDPSPAGTQAIVTFVETLLNDGEVQRKITALKAVRDKRIAHNELFIGQLDEITWNGVMDLVKLAESVVTVIGSGYTSTVYGQDGEFWLTDDAERPSRGLLRLMERAGVIPPRHPPQGMGGSQEQ